MKRKISTAFLVLTSLWIVSCSSNPTVKINSFPEGATVAMRSGQDGTKFLGKTPLELKASELASSSSNITALSFSKEGFQDQYLTLVQNRGTENFEITAKLLANEVDAKSVDLKSRQEKLAQKLVRAHNLITQKRLPEAEGLLQEVIRDYPSVSVGYDLLGNVSYLQRNLTRARTFYEKSLQLNPENEGARAMIKKLSSNQVDL